MFFVVHDYIFITIISAVEKHQQPQNQHVQDPRNTSFSLNNISKCNTQRKILRMFEAWVYTGVSNENEARSCKDNHKWRECIQWTFIYILDCVLSFCEMKGIDAKYYHQLLRMVCVEITFILFFIFL